MNSIQVQDIQEFSNSFALANELAESTFLITGASGLIGSSLIFCLLSLNLKIKIHAPVRNKDKAEKVLQEYANQVNIVECNISNYDYSSLGKIDYIIHCAAPTSSKFFVEKPVETFEFIYEGTSALLKYAKTYSVKSFIYLSSLEVYGSIQDDSVKITEDKMGYLNPLSERSSYPMAKRATETLCHLYAKEFNVPVKIARLTQTTGAGISKDDCRIIAEFTRCATQGNDIILHTTGESARPYCYITDCISAILYILLKGANGEAYNVANEETYISAKDMAFFLRDHFNPSIQVKTNITEGMGYAPTTRQKLSTKRLQKLGWEPKYNLHKIFKKTWSYLASLQ